MEHEIYRDLGAHKVDIQNLKEQVSSIRKDVTEIKDMLNQARGGWKAMMAIGGLAAALSSVVTGLVFKLLGALKW
jgi:hypothetical protein